MAGNIGEVAVRQLDIEKLRGIAKAVVELSASYSLDLPNFDAPWHTKW